MKMIMFFIVITISLNSVSQNYQNICTQGKTTYLSTTSHFASFRLDSVHFQSGDSIFYSYMAFRDTSIVNQYPLPCTDTTKGSILGRKVLRRPDGTFKFFNRYSDTIILKPSASLNETWKIIGLPNNCYLEAKVTGKALETFLGISDSVKTITLQAKNQSGISISHPMNGKVIKLSKSYGLTEFYDVYYFPNSATQYSLYGKSYPVIGFQDPTAEEIYNWPVGAVFHYRDYGGYCFNDNINSEKSELPPQYYYDNYTIKTILQKTVTTDSIVYYCQICTLEIEGWWGISADTTQWLDSRTESYKFSTENSLLEKLPDEYNPTGNYYTLKISQINNVPARTVRDSLYTRDQDCWKVNTYDIFETKTFVKNLGETNEFSQVHGGVLFFCTNHDLVYFSCDTLTWGAPLFEDCSVLLSTKNKIIPTTNGLLFMPNPVTSSSFVEISAAVDKSNQLTFCLFDEMGRKLKTQPVRGNSFILNREGFAGGLYFYSLNDNQGKICASGKIMIR